MGRGRSGRRARLSRPAGLPFGPPFLEVACQGCRLRQESQQRHPPSLPPPGRDRKWVNQQPQVKDRRLGPQGAAGPSRPKLVETISAAPIVGLLPPVREKRQSMRVKDESV